MPTEEWTPSEFDLGWMRNLVGTIRDGGVWGVPINGSSWRIHHNDKTVECLFAGVEGSQAVSDRIIKAFEAIGYTVKLPMAVCLN